MESIFDEMEKIGFGKVMRAVRANRGRTLGRLVGGAALVGGLTYGAHKLHQYGKRKEFNRQMKHYQGQMPKTAAAPSLLAALAGQTIKYPGMVAWRLNQIDRGMGAHRQAMRDLEQGVPAGWASLGMRPRNVGR
jgi:hypothetical protein